MLHWLVVGVGDISTRRVIPAIQAEARSHLHGVVTLDPAKGRPYSENVWTDLDSALRDSGSSVDAVYVATPVALHGPQSMASLRAGKHVLCEKPMAMNYAQAYEMARVATEEQRLLGIAYYRRLFPKVLRARDLIAQGAIGRPVYADANCHSELPGQDGTRTWLLDPGVAGGGPLYDIASHRIDLMNYFFGRPVRVSGQLSNAVHRIAVEDNATVMIEYDNGVRGVVDVRWHSEIARDEFRIIGTSGEINLDPVVGPRLIHPSGVEDLPRHDNLHFPCIENFVSAVLDGTPLAATGESSLWTDWVTEQAARAVAS